MEEQNSTHPYPNSDSYPSPRSRSSPSPQGTDTASSEQRQEKEQKLQESLETQKSTSHTSVADTNKPTSLNELPLSKAANGQIKSQNGIQSYNQPHEEQQISSEESKEEQQQTRQPSVITSAAAAVLAATHPTTNQQLSHHALSLNAFFPHSDNQHNSQMTAAQSSQAAALRYSLTAQGADERIMAGGRNRKEIKRRTKTGCLTCRKRRIKVN